MNEMALNWWFHFFFLDSQYKGIINESLIITHYLVPLLICTWFFKSLVWKIQFEELAVKIQFEINIKSSSLNWIFPKLEILEIKCRSTGECYLLVLYFYSICEYKFLHVLNSETANLYSKNENQPFISALLCNFYHF